MDWRDHLRDAGLEPTWIKDRQYFQSVYARGPGGVLFEVATDGPGVTADESIADLGAALRLPEQFEEDRAVIEDQLPPLCPRPSAARAARARPAPEPIPTDRSIVRVVRRPNDRIRPFAARAEKDYHE